MARPRFQLVPGGRFGRPTDAGGVGWRLLGSNNRELGRSALSFPDVDAAAASIARVRRLVADGEARILHETSVGHWVWQLQDDDVVVAQSGRGFRYERECRYNLEQFRGVAPWAPAAQTEAPAEFPWQRQANGLGGRARGAGGRSRGWPPDP